MAVWGETTGRRHSKRVHTRTQHHWRAHTTDPGGGARGTSMKKGSWPTNRNQGTDKGRTDGTQLLHMEGVHERMNEPMNK